LVPNKKLNLSWIKCCTDRIATFSLKWDALLFLPHPCV
jgi:hypothetical protein